MDMDDPEKFALIFFDENGDYNIGRIRKLTPRECWRWQGFKDWQFDKVAATGMSDSKLYRMAGNAVTVDVVMAVGQVIWKFRTANTNLLSIFLKIQAIHNRQQTFRLFQYG